MNLVLIILTTLLALGAAFSPGRSTSAAKPVTSVTSVSANAPAAVVVPMASPTDAPSPGPYDQTGGGPSH